MSQVIIDTISKFENISLKDMDEVKLLNRIDTKYVIGRDILPLILEKISPHYYTLEINNKRIFSYSSLYFDTDINTLYLAHHNGKMNRYKIRQREYIGSNLCFLEIKFKTKGNRTIKYRTKINSIEKELSEDSLSYIKKHTPFAHLNLKPVIYTNFDRITLVNKNFTERVTIDMELEFKQNGGNHELGNVAIIELKRDAASGNSELINTLEHFRVFPQGFSKYCIGRAYVEKNLKSNNFKERILTINKINDGRYYYSNFSQNGDIRH